MTQQVHRFTEPAAAAAALAAAIAADLRAALSRQSRALLLVSGGRSPIPVFAALARQDLEWVRIDVSLVDERSVAPDHADANAQLVRRHMLTGAAAQAGWIPLMPPALATDMQDAMTAAREAARLADTDARLAAPAAILLGMGNDGHTASLVADAPQWDEARRTAHRYLALQPQAAPHARISLSLSALRAGQRCYLWAAGPDKAATLARLQQAGDAAMATASEGETGGAMAVAEKLAAAGPVAILLADPALLLEVYCCEQAVS